MTPTRWRHLRWTRVTPHHQTIKPTPDRVRNDHPHPPLTPSASTTCNTRDITINTLLCIEMPPDADEQRPLLSGDSGSGNHATAADAASDNGETRGGGGDTFTRNLGTVEAFAIVISIVIGSGVFTSPGSIDTNVPSPGVALAVWLVGGVLAWTGASTLVELGAAIPGEGMRSLQVLSTRD